jgi:predicted DNA-binding transcriptional regulator AlpA
MALSNSTSTYLTAAQLRLRYGGASRMWLHRKLATDPSFPRPVNLGTTRRYWKRLDIEAWEAVAIAQAVRS